MSLRPTGRQVAAHSPTLNTGRERARRMRRAPLAIALGSLAIAAAPASATLVGQGTQSSNQGINSTQSAAATNVSGNTIVVGAGAPTATPEQLSLNSAQNAQTIGQDDGGSVLVGDDKQSSNQGVNSAQTSTNGAVGIQGSANLLGNGQIVGGGPDCFFESCDASVIVGNPTQSSNQGVNSSQSADGGSVSGDSIVVNNAPFFLFNAPAGPIQQFSGNVGQNDQIILA